MTRRVFFHLPVFAFLVWAAPLFANSAGIPGYSGKNGPLVICNVCHGGGATPIVSLTGPATLNPNGTGTFTFTVQSADRDIQVAAGIGIAASGGTLQVVTGQGEKLQNGEITHSAPPKPNDTNGVTMWTFKWKAPATAGNYILFAAGNSVNQNFANTGDRAGATTLSVAVGNVTPLPTNTPIATPSPSPSATASATATRPAPTTTRTPIPSSTPTFTPVSSTTPTVTPEFPTPTPTDVMPTATPIGTATNLPTDTPTEVPTFTATPSPSPVTSPGDANCDLKVTAADLSSVVLLASRGSAGVCGADVNGDGVVDDADITATISALFER